MVAVYEIAAYHAVEDRHLGEHILIVAVSRHQRGKRMPLDCEPTRIRPVPSSGNRLYGVRLMLSRLGG